MASPEQKKAYQVIKQFKGLNTKANRTAIEEDEFSWLENAMPIGYGNLKIVPSFTDLNVAFIGTVVNFVSCSIGLTDYVIAFLSDGGAQVVDLSTNIRTTIAGSGTFSSSGNVSIAQYKNKYVGIVDENKGYFIWDGTNLVSVGSIGRIAITASGSGYKSAPSVTLSAPNQTGGIQATAICAVSNGAGTVVGAVITNGGTGYTSIPATTVSSPPYPGITAQVSAGISGGSVVSISVINPGSGYSSNATITFTGGGGSAAAATAIVDSGSIIAIALINAGTGYTSPPTVTFSGGGGTGASAKSELVTFATGTVTVNVTNGGYGYTSPPTVTIGNSTGWTTQAVGTAVISGGQVTQVLMTDHGAGYTNASNVVVSFSGGGFSTAATANAVINTDTNTAIASFSGRMWIASARNVFYSAPYSISDFTSLSAGSLTMADSTLHGYITQIISANNFLYVFGDDSINVFSDVRVTSSGNTLFTNTNISASVGSKRPYAIFPYFRSLLFMNDYGIYALVGSTTTKISDPLDGIFPYIDFTAPIYAGQVLINNILCAAFNFKYTGTGGGGTADRYLQAVFFDKKWFLTSQYINFGQNDVKYITSSPIGGKITIYAVASNYLYKLYTNESASIPSYVQTALLPMGDPIRTKQALKFGFEASNNSGYSFDVTIDSEQSSSATTTIITNSVNWTNSLLVGSTIIIINYYAEYDNTIIFQSLDDPPNYIQIGTQVIANYIPAGTYVTGYGNSEAGPVAVLNNPTTTAPGIVESGDFYDPTAGSNISWTNNSLQTITWTVGSPYFLYKGDAQQWGKYIGMTIKTNSSGMTYNTFEFEHELRTRF